MKVKELKLQFNQSRLLLGEILGEETTPTQQQLEIERLDAEIALQRSLSHLII
jgi:hypothetical protein